MGFFILNISPSTTRLSEVKLILYFPILVPSGCWNRTSQSECLKSLRPGYQLGQTKDRISSWLKGGIFRLSSYRMGNSNQPFRFLLQVREPVNERFALRIQVSEYKFNGEAGNTQYAVLLFTQKSGTKEFSEFGCPSAPTTLGDYNGKKKELDQFINFE